MKRILFFLLIGSLLGATGCSAADHDFDSVVAGVEHRYSAHVQHIPLMAVASFCTHLYTHGGVNDIHIAEFDGLLGVDAVELSTQMQSELGNEWQPFLTEREQGTDSSDAEHTVIFARPHGHAMRMLIADYEHGKLDLIRIDVNGASLSKWIQQQHGRRTSPHRYAAGE